MAKTLGVTQAWVRGLENIEVDKITVLGNKADLPTKGFDAGRHAALLDVFGLRDTA